ncbi:MAG: hypothetical protein GQ532_10520 [Methylomarinum sp.]|nr:hypothetical protein [Methylomarinum sp.]
MIKIIILLGSVILSLSSFNSYAKAEQVRSNDVVKKYFVSKPAYNGHVVKIYQQDLVDDINNQIAINGSAAGLINIEKNPVFLVNIF